MNERTPNNRASFEKQKVREAIERLVQSDLRDEQKVLVLLAYAGVKPVSEMDFPGNEHARDRVEFFRDTLRKLSLKFDEEAYVFDGLPRIHFDFARNLGDLEQMREMERRFGTERPPEWHRLHGKAYGFPDTVIHAYVNKDTIKRLPEDAPDTPTARFHERGVAMRLSRAHWRSELKVMDEWLQAARENAPEYIDHLISDAWVAPKGGGH